jgi:hypothetical protein
MKEKLVYVAIATVVGASVGAGVSLARPERTGSVTVIRTVRQPHTVAAARYAAEAFWGALSTRHARDLCAQSPVNAIASAENNSASCLNAARDVVRGWSDARVRIGQIVISGNHATIREHFSDGGGDTLWRFVYVHGRWLYDEANYAPAKR